MKIQKSSVIAIRYNHQHTKAVMKGGQCVWRVPWFNVKELAIYKPKESYYAEVGDVLFVDRDNNKKIYSRYADFDELKEEGYRPIALCAIPGKFNVYGDCTTCFVALNYISENTPEDGTSYEDEPVYFNTVDNSSCNYGSEFYSSPGAAIKDNLAKQIKGFYPQPILPSDYWNGSDEDYVLSNDGVGYYLRLGVGNNSNTTNRAYSPSPYYRDQSQQELWWYSTSTQQKTIQSNFNGSELTDMYLQKFSDGRINAINYIKKYNPQNSNTAEQWYLGATGEMAMMICRVGVLNDSITKLRIVFGHEIAAFFQTKSLMTANIPDDTSDLRIKNIGMKSVAVSNDNMSDAELLCRPMIKFENTTNKVRINIDWNNYLSSIIINGRIYYTWTKTPYVEMPIGSTIKYQLEIINGYVTDEPLSGEFEVTEETTLGITSAYVLGLEESIVESWEAEVGDYLCYVGGGMVIVKQSCNLASIKEYGYVPVAIVVTPGSHNVYKDCSVACVALNWASKDNDNGTTTYNNTFTFSTNSSISNPPSSLLCVEGPMIIGPKNNTIKGFIERPCLPSTSLNEGPTQSISMDGKACYNDTKSESNTSMYWYSPSIYLEDGSMNPMWWYAEKDRQTTYQRSFNGQENTQTIINMGNKDQYPAAYAAYNYYPKGADETVNMWHLSDAGECAYLITRIREINKSLQNLIDVFGTDNICIIDSSSSSFALSSLFSNQRYNNISFSVLLFGNNANSSSNCAVRPFIKFDSTTDKVKINLDFSNTDDIVIDNRHYYSWEGTEYIQVKRGSSIKIGTELINVIDDITV